KIMSSDGCKGDTVPLEMGPWYDFHEVGCHLGNVGSYPKVVRLEGEQKRQGHELKRQKELTTKLMERNKKLMDLYIKAVG
ncbi:MAG TPA: hypothetical protein QF556_05760, partial [Rhodospirillales bacterium]|nr:hypothetical protein [Rhodospirillales bacterium]